MEVVDIFMFNNEMTLLDLRIKILEDVVDKFIIKEAEVTFQGNTKEALGKTYNHPKVFVETVEYEPDWTIWQRDKYHRASRVNLKKFNVSDDALILMSDLDEIPNPLAVAWLRDNFDYDTVYSFEQLMFQGYLNVRNLSEKWAGTRACSVDIYNTSDAETLKQDNDNVTLIENAGWHWSFLGGVEEITRKIKDYAHNEFNTPLILNQVQNRLLNGIDVLGRNCILETVEIDDSYPQYIKENLDKLSNLIRH